MSTTPGLPPVDVPPMVDLDAQAGLGEVTTRVRANSELIRAAVMALKAISDSYAAALPTSVADRQGLHASVDALGASLANLSTALATVRASAASTSTDLAAEVTARAQAISAQAAAVAKVASDLATEATARRDGDTARADATAKVASDLAALAARHPRTATAQSVPGMAVQLSPMSTDVTLTWAQPWPDTSYDVVPILDLPVALLGKTMAVVKTKAVASCVVTVTTTAALSAGTVTVRAVSVSTT